ncbi:alpha/beta hydrolase [Zhouia sp. PK063]|uniref:alpha/beta hydrolase n=1 Tax=Zhouia sp. PK063 TaxID=3373602 RepID=UPI003797113A
MKTTILSFLCFFSLTISQAQTASINLWKQIPGEKKDASYKLQKSEDHGILTGLSKVTNPILDIYPAQNNSSGTAVIICPGGGYQFLAVNHEGKKIAEWFNSIGVTAFVLKYRLPSDLIMKNKNIGPLQDVQRAIRYVRGNASKWNLKRDKIGIMGFSAGGHLAASASTLYNDNIYDTEYHVSARPDFSILMYPVISMNPTFTHMGSRTNLIGEHPSQEIENHYSTEKQVNEKTPPTFLVHCSDDTIVPVKNSLVYYEALIKNHVPAEMHIYQKGGHGFGLGDQQSTDIDWAASCEHWLKMNHIIP